jgi:hypothetical protein
VVVVEEEGVHWRDERDGRGGDDNGRLAVEFGR